MEIERNLDDEFNEETYNIHEGMINSFRRYAELNDDEPITEELLDRYDGHVSYLGSINHMPSYKATREILLGNFDGCTESYLNYRRSRKNEN